MPLINALEVVLTDKKMTFQKGVRMDYFFLLTNNAAPIAAMTTTAPIVP